MLPNPSLHVTSGDGHDTSHGVSSTRPRRLDGLRHLSAPEGLLTVVTFVLWLILFGGGILIDTEPFRRTISPQGAAALAGELSDTLAATAPTPADIEGSHTIELTLAAAEAPQETAGPGLLVSCLVTLLWFLPLNLALLCAISGILGAFGNRANLHAEDAPPVRGDESNPTISALLRGFFVYLIVISGLLLLDDDPFSKPTPGQYIRLAGFLSLLSFVVNYQPQVFGSLLGRAVERIQSPQHGPSGSMRSSIQYHEREIEASIVNREALPASDANRSALDGSPDHIGNNDPLPDSSDTLGR